MDNPWFVYGLLCPAAALGGAINSIAGGGTLITFPALMLILGAQPNAAIIANATNTVAMFPGSLASAWGYRRELQHVWDWVLFLALPSLIGGLLGSLIVVKSPESSFRMMVPWLIGLATLLFILQPRLTPAVAVEGGVDNQSTKAKWGVFLIQLLIGLYGGYFGAGIGILMLSSLSLLNLGSIHHANAMKTVLASLINGISVAVFMQSDVVHWGYGIPMLLSASFGGWLGASWARLLDRRLVRRIVIAIGLVLTTWYFGQIYFQ